MHNKKIFLMILIGLAIIVAGFYFWHPRSQPASAPSISITSPLSGDIWLIGSEHAITWTTKNIPPENKISVTLRRIPPPPLPAEGQEFDPILFINLPNTGSVDWIISRPYPAGTYVLGINSYRSIPVTNAISAESAPFKIKPLP